MADAELGRMVVWCGAGVLLCALVHALFKLFSGRSEDKQPASTDQSPECKETNGGGVGGDGEPSERPSKQPKKRPAWKSKSDFAHPWLLKSLKGHPGEVLHVDFSSNGKYLAAACEDGSVLLWDVRELGAREHRNVRVNVELDHANFVAWSPDSRAFVVHKVRDCCIKVYKLEKKKDGTIGTAKPGLDFETVHQDPVVGFGIACNGKFMMSCSAKTELVLWDLRGEQLDKLDTYLMSTYSAKISPCGRFVVATGFSPDVKVLEVCFSRGGGGGGGGAGGGGEYAGTKRAFELTGHTSGVWDVAFDADTSHIATLSKDGTWKLYHTNIEYSRGESPYVVSSGSYTQGTNPPHLAISPNAEVLIVAVDNSLQFYDTASGDHYYTVEKLFAGPINCVRFDASGKYVFAAGERAVRVLHNVCGYHAAANTCRRLLRAKQTSATVERLNATLADCEEMLAKLHNFSRSGKRLLEIDLENRNFKEINI